ncbi:MAG: MBL fold metallo-hydrolase [Cyanobacteria bacterium SID2]|nr:MBL fold metallo-hydrolase [Cyanobacteria bacterium SID2]
MVKDLAITVLVENTAWGRDLLGEHGLAWWIEADGHRILFDTGQGYVLKHNAKQLDISLNAAEAIVLSHGHDDHAGGLSDVLAECGAEVDLYLHPDTLKPKYSPRGEIGAPLRDADELERRVRRLVVTAEPMQVVPGVWLTGTIPRTHPLEDTGGSFWHDRDRQEIDRLLDDRSLFIETSKGLVVVLGCAHSGVINTLDYIADLTGVRRIYAVMGGMHLLRANRERLQATVDALSRYEVQHVGANHCTGTKAISFFWERLLDRCFECRVGTRFEVRD